MLCLILGFEYPCCSMPCMMIFYSHHCVGDRLINNLVLLCRDRYVDSRGKLLIASL